MDMDRGTSASLFCGECRLDQYRLQSRTASGYIRGKYSSSPRGGAESRSSNVTRRFDLGKATLLRGLF